MRRGLGQFQPHNGLSGRRGETSTFKTTTATATATATATTATATATSPVQPPKKRRRTDEVPSTPSPLSRDGAWQRSSPDQSRSQRHGSASSFLTGDEPQIVVTSAGRRRGRRRRVTYSINDRPKRLTSPSIADSNSDPFNDSQSAEIVDDSDDDIEIQGDDTPREVPRPKTFTEKASTEKAFAAKTTTGPTRHNTELSIVLDGGLPKRQPFRSRMQSDVQGTASGSTPASTIPLKRPIYDSRRFSESADELSEDHYHLQRPPKKTVKSPNLSSLHGPPTMLSRPNPKVSSGPVSTSAGTIIESPVRVVSAFRLPLYIYQSDQPAQTQTTQTQTQALTMTIDSRDPDTLILADSAQRARLPWLRIPLDRALAIQHNMNSCSLCLDFPQDTKYNAPMGIRFATTSDLRRVVTWILESPLLKTIRLQNVELAVLNKTFEKGLASAKEHRESVEMRAKVDATFDDSVDLDSDTESSPLYKSNKPNKSAPAPASTTPSAPALPPREAEASLVRVYKDGLASLRRTRNSLNYGSPTELVSLDTDRKKKEPASPKPASASGTPTKDSPDTTDSRLSRLRNRNSRASLRYIESPKVERWTEQNPNWSAGWKVPLTYSRTTVDKDDVARLDEGEFLNDNIINFYLQYLQGTLKKSESSIAKRVYFHNTFFYEKLRPSRGNVISFEGVKRWTAKVDLFSYDYIVVPVNENAHWWVAIICNVPKILAAALPKVEGPKDDKTSPPRPNSIVVDDDDRNANKNDNEDAEVKFVSASASPSTNKKTAPLVVNSIEVDDDSKTAPNKSASPNSKDTPTEIKDASDDGGESKDDDEVTETLPSDPSLASALSPVKKPIRVAGRSSKKVFIPNGKKPDPTDPRIFTLDSLGSVHTASVDHLKQWLMAEIAERKGVKPLDPGRLGTTAKGIPEQENFCDCGLYLLLYIREFTNDPDGFIEDIVLRRKRDWNTSAPDMRKQLRELIMHMQKEYQDAEEAAKRLKKQQHLKRTAAAASSSSAPKPSETVSLPQMKPKSKPKDKDDENKEDTEMTEIGDTSSIVRSSSPIIESEQPTPREMSGPPPAVVTSDLTFDLTTDVVSDIAKKGSESEESVPSTAEAEGGISSPFKEDSPLVYMRPT